MNLKLIKDRNNKITYILNNICINCLNFKLNLEDYNLDNLYCNKCAEIYFFYPRNDPKNSRHALCPFCDTQLSMEYCECMEEHPKPYFFTSICVDCFSFHLQNIYKNYNKIYSDLILKRNCLILDFLNKYNYYKTIYKNNNNKLIVKKEDYKFNSKMFKLSGNETLDYKLYDPRVSTLFNSDMDEEDLYVYKSVDIHMRLIRYPFIKKSNIYKYHLDCMMKDKNL